MTRRNSPGSSYLHVVLVPSHLDRHIQKHFNRSIFFTPCIFTLNEVSLSHKGCCFHQSYVCGVYAS